MIVREAMGPGRVIQAAGQDAFASASYQNDLFLWGGEGIKRTVRHTSRPARSPLDKEISQS